MSNNRDDSDRNKPTGIPAEEGARPRLDRLTVAKDNEARIQADLDRVLQEKLLARTDVGDALAKDLAAANMSLPTLSEIDQVLARLQTPEPTAAEIERFLALDNIGDISLDGMRLNELLDKGATGITEQKMLRRGTLFLRREMYREAAEWWLLHRPHDELADSRLYLLMTLFLALTYKLSDQEEKFQAALAEARNTRLSQRIK
jgi:hypothetical protein